MCAVEHEASLSSIRTFAGDPAEVRRQLDRVKGGHVVAVVLNTSSVREAKTIEQVLAQTIQLTQETLTSQSEDVLSTIVSTLLPKEMLSPNHLQEAKMMLRTKEAVLSGTEWLSAANVAEVARLSDRNPSAQVLKWKRDGALFAIYHNGVDYFPSYALDPNNEYHPHRALKKVIGQFADHKEGWSLACWFQSANSFLGGQRPMDLLSKKSDDVIAAAADEVLGVVHA